MLFVDSLCSSAVECSLALVFEVGAEGLFDGGGVIFDVWVWYYVIVFWL